MTTRTKKRRELVTKAAFSVNARVALQLGRESISSSVTAIIELVKNSFDADATEVKIRFANLDGGKGENQARRKPFLVIEDDGSGMTPDELRDKWMVIGTSNKLGVAKSKSKSRILTGEKGLGRLGLDRLCEKTIIQSVTENSTSGVELVVDWSKYERSANVKRLEQITHPIYEVLHFGRDPISKSKHAFSKGTRLILTELKDNWDEPALAELQSELSLLHSPFGNSDDFKIKLDTGGFAKSLDGVINPESAILDAAYWKVLGKIDDGGNVSIHMSSTQHDRTYSLNTVPWDKFTKSTGTLPRCGPLELTFYFFRRQGFEKAQSSFTTAKLGTFLKNNQGIRIYRDRFRVKPYGEPNGEGDWLRLGFRRTINPEGVKQKGNWKLGYNQVVGAVLISREGNPELIDQTNREGLVVGDAFRHLYIFADRVLTFFERNHQDHEKHRDEDNDNSESKQTEKSLEDAGKALKTIAELEAALTEPKLPNASAPSERAPTDIKLNESLGIIAKSLKSLEATVKEETSKRHRTEQEKNTLANLASLGILAACFGHETCGWAATVQANAGWLHRNLIKHLYMVTPNVESTIAEALSDINTDAKKLQTFAAFALGNVRPDKRKYQDFCIKSLIQEVLSAFQDSLQQQKGITIDFTQTPSGECTIRGYRIDWESIFANLITNAMWAITKHDGDRNIQVCISDNGSAPSYTIQFHDSGFGLEAGTESLIFDAGFSTKRNNKGEKDGTGMGLYIVQAFLREHPNTTIKAIANGPLGGASFEITVPKAPPSA